MLEIVLKFLKLKVIYLIFLENMNLPMKLIGEPLKFLWEEQKELNKKQDTL